MSESGKTTLSGYVDAFERVTGRPPTEEENREALALADVVKAANLDPFLVYYLANKRAQDAFERVPIATQSIMDQATEQIRETMATGMSMNERHALFDQLDRIEALFEVKAAVPIPVPAPASVSVPKWLPTTLLKLSRIRPWSGLLTRRRATATPSSHPLRSDDVTAQLNRIVELCRRNARPEVALAYGTHRRTIIAFVFAAAVVAFTSALVSDWSHHAALTLIVAIAFITGVSAATAYYELSR